MTDHWEVLVPIVMFLSIVAIVGLVMHFRTERAKATGGAGAQYRALAEEAVKSQKQLLEEVRHMNASLREIERLLREV